MMKQNEVLLAKVDGLVVKSAQPERLVAHPEQSIANLEQSNANLEQFNTYMLEDNGELRRKYSSLLANMG